MYRYTFMFLLKEDEFLDESDDNNEEPMQTDQNDPDWVPSAEEMEENDDIIEEDDVQER